MPIVAQLRHATFTDVGSQAALAAMSATHELVLIVTRDVMPDDGVSQLRRILAPRRIVVLLIDDHLPSTERALIEELSNDGTIPVILTRCEFLPPDLTSWHDSDEPAVQQQWTHRAARRRRTLAHRPVIRHPGIDRGDRPIERPRADFNDDRPHVSDP
jgi:hypothetical protein